MKKKAPVKPHGSGCTVTIEVSPGAARSELVGLNEWRGTVQMRISAVAREGAANEELVRFLADRLGVAKSDVIIMKGERSSKKVVYLPVSVEKIASLLEAE